jgi:hypothetical protein
MKTPCKSFVIAALQISNSINDNPGGEKNHPIKSSENAAESK